MEWLSRYGTWMDVVFNRHRTIAGVIAVALIVTGFNVSHGWIIWVVLLMLTGLGGLGSWLDNRRVGSS
jgi:hypothetical protein